MEALREFFNVFGAAIVVPVMIFIVMTLSVQRI